MAFAPIGGDEDARRNSVVGEATRVARTFDNETYIERLGAYVVRDATANEAKTIDTAANLKTKAAPALSKLTQAVTNAAAKLRVGTGNVVNLKAASPGPWGNKLQARVSTSRAKIIFSI